MGQSELNSSAFLRIINSKAGSSFHCCYLSWNACHKCVNIKNKDKFVFVHAIKNTEGMEVFLNLFLTLAIYGDARSFSLPWSLYLQGKIAGVM